MIVLPKNIHSLYLMLSFNGNSSVIRKKKSKRNPKTKSEIKENTRKKRILHTAAAFCIQTKAIGATPEIKHPNQDAWQPSAPTNEHSYDARKINDLKISLAFNNTTKCTLRQIKLVTSLKGVTPLHAARLSGVVIRSDEELPCQKRISESFAALFLKK